MGTFTTKLKLGGKAFVVRGGIDPYIEELTVGQIRVIETLPNQRSFTDDPCYLEEYMCIETGVGSGSIWKYGRNIFATENEARHGDVEHQQRAYKERLERDTRRAEEAEIRKNLDLIQLQHLQEKYGQSSLQK